MGKETEHSQSVVECDDDYLTPGSERLAVVERQSSGTGREPPARNVDQHGKLRRGGLRAVPDVKGETVLADRIRVEERVLQRYVDHLGKRSCEEG